MRPLNTGKNPSDGIAKCKTAAIANMPEIQGPKAVAKLVKARKAPTFLVGSADQGGGQRMLKTTAGTDEQKADGDRGRAGGDRTDFEGSCIKLLGH